MHPLSGKKSTTEEEAHPEWLSLQDFCSILSISPATGRNWLRLGKVTPQKRISNKSYFSHAYVNHLKKSLESGENTALKSRRNKKYISGTDIDRSYVSEQSKGPQYLQVLLDNCQKYQLNPDQKAIRILLAECACQLLLTEAGKAFPPKSSCLAAYLEGVMDLGGYDFLIDDLIPDREAAMSFLHEYPDLFDILYENVKGDDLLGFLYISLKHLGTRKAMGAYYTPSGVVKKLCRELFPEGDYTGKKILDPCCGTGNFLLHLPEDLPMENIYGKDIDEVSVTISRINLALRYGIKDRDLLYSHVTCADYLGCDPSEKYDYIMGNPPWGYDFSQEEKTGLRGRFLTASGSGIESFVLFIEESLRHLTYGGRLSFVLPESLLHVKSHRTVRKILCRSCDFEYIEYLGNIFDKVHCPCIIFQVKYTGAHASCVGMKVRQGHRTHQIRADRPLSEEGFHFLTSDREENLLRKIDSIDNKCCLKGNAIFALGLVTGNNKKYLSSQKTGSMEGILKGSDLRKYRAKEASQYIAFKPEVFQQVAPEAYYRAPEKLLYRFICKQLVFAYDNRQSLSLNSCNLLIPQIEGLSIRYILAVLNSRVAGFYFKNRFHSVKVLRSHVEQIPIPFVEKKQQEEILPYVESLLGGEKGTDLQEIYDRLDTQIARLYRLSPDDYRLIRESMAEENLFLL